MNKVPVQRRLAAILAADVVGYSRLLERDEAGTLAALTQLRKSVLDPLIGAHQGRVVKVMGDGVLVEFGSAVNAVTCAVDLQQKMAVADEGAGGDRRIQFRIGINLGDVVVEDDDIYGDGVVIAVRLQAVSEPGGICISAGVHEQVEKKLPLAFADLGAQTLKNIERPVRAYRIDSVPAATSGGAPALHAKPSIAVLPFTNMSGDPEQQYFSDGITEDIITELSRYRSLLVIARNSAFQFRGPSIDMRAVRQRLGVRFIVEGSVRRAGNRVRITAQLIDAEAESHLWAERYDRDMQDIFAVQDEVARTIATTLEGRVAASGAEQVRRKPTRDWKAYDYVLRGRECDARYDHHAGEPLFARAAELDPGYAEAHGRRAVALVVMYWMEQRPELLRQAEVCAREALSLDENDAKSQEAMAYVLCHQRKFELSGSHFDRAIALNPNDVVVAMDRANFLSRTGRADEALQALEAAMRREPFPHTWFWEVRFTALFQLKRYAEAIAAIGNMAILHPLHHAYLASALAHAGRLDEARDEVAKILAGRPGANLAYVAAAEPYSDPALLEHLLDGLRKAGLQ
jgi:TolB-like protein